MRKRVFFTICLLVCMLLPAIALAASVPEQETRELMGQFDAARQKIETGIDYPAFCILRQELGQATQVFKEKYPEGEATEDFGYLNRLYGDIEETWRLKAEYKVQFLPKTKEQGKARGTTPYFIHTIMLKMAYPDAMNVSLESKEHGYFINSVLDNLLGHAVSVTNLTGGKWLQ